MAPNYFVRDRIFKFEIVFSLLINLLKNSYQTELDRFFQALDKKDIPERIVTKQAFSKARMKLDFEAFIEINDDTVAFFYKEHKPLTWNGFTLMAIDGSTVQVPDNKECRNYFGIQKSQGKDCPIARVSQIYDALNKITVEALIGKYDVGELEMAATHFMKLMPKDLVLLDRGYPAYWLFNLILSQNADFCARITTSGWNVVKDFVASGETEKIILLNAPPSSLKMCKELGLDTNPIALRLVRVELETGEIEVLITSLLDVEKYSSEIFEELYHQRWPVEEDYKTLKYRIELGNWSGETVLSVYQDFHAKVLAKNLTAVLAFPAIEQIKDQSSGGKKQPRQLNFAQAISTMKNSIMLLLNRPRKAITDMLRKLYKIFYISTEPIRKGRKYPRKQKVRPRPFHKCYKSTR